jgi:molybdopterin/thiamine biosynthesis adenylyltransferase
VLIPRGVLEREIAAHAPDPATSIVLYCAAGNRSALAAQSLELMGYTSVASLAGGFEQWKIAGRPWHAPQGLSPEQRGRYDRHLSLPEVGVEGQQRLLGSRVLVIGAGGLGSPVATYLAAAGVGTLGLVDGDVVDPSNLQRQVLHDVGAIGRMKVDSARERLTSINPDVEIETHGVRLSASNALEIMAGYDVVVDGADNFPTRYLVNDASLHLRVPVVHGSILRFEGRAAVFAPYRGPCYRCLYPEPPPPELAPSCAEAGVLGALPGVIGSIQATEALKLLLGAGEPLIGRLLTYEALEQRFTEVRFRRDPACAACGDEDHPPPLIDYDETCRPA